MTTTPDPHPEWWDSMDGRPRSLTEKISFAVQGAMRRWTFVFAYTLLSVAWWIFPAWFGDNSSYVHWQLWASYMALFIESVVGIGMFSIQKKDAVILRRELVIAQQQTQLIAQMGQKDRDNQLLLQEIQALVEENLELVGKILILEEEADQWRDRA
jgi:hypothetical protein